jgi:hypothetical protein
LIPETSEGKITVDALEQIVEDEIRNKTNE